MYRGLFNFVKRKIPRISETELIALRSGSTSLDRSILEGNVILPPKPNVEINKFSNNEVESLLKNFDNTRVYPNDNNNKWVEHLATKKYFSFLIDEKYGGIKLSTNELSNLLTKIASVDPALGVVTMVPNSLGPGELLTKYGTEEQKDYYLPKLAYGSMIPCFGLTGPNNGSDATGSIDTGVVVERNGKKMIKVNLNKRYITLAPVANLLGIAFKLEDPDNLIGKSGVTVALVERGHHGLIQKTHHNPMNAGFPNGTIKGEFYIDIDQVIGGEENVGNGWKMLMECLAAGRGVSLPATANASSKVATYGIFNYMKVREQFKLPLAKMEAIQEKFISMMIDTWIIQSSISLTNDILDNGSSPAVISAIMKQQTTERGRNVLNHGLDIHGGAGICIGHSNFLEKFYRSAPIGITVEGSNTLTRSLIIFGQGLNKSHPYIYPILESVLNNDINAFRKGFNNLIGHGTSMYFKSFNIVRRNILEQQIINFANLTNFVAIKGGALKREQMLSGDMADIFSNLYLALSVQYYQNNNNSSEILTKHIINMLCNENQRIINRVIDNLGSERVLLKHMKKEVENINYNSQRALFNEIMDNPNIMNEVKKNIYFKDVLKDFEDISVLAKNTDEYNVLHNKIINVDEYYNLSENKN